AVYGVPSRTYGEEVAAAIRLAPGATASPEEILEFCRGRMADYKIPRYLHFVDGFPQTASGKIQKFKLRERARRDLAPDSSSPTAN
ncbi:AMP-binding protein, partial [Acidobacteriia bacterium AH_259_A11_L15]|nr:AMP-binding protein [Acidobacteriia bacterium AH_259_A11_L15]